MHTIHEIRYWLLLLVWVGTMALQLWALVDCIGRKTAAFPAANKLTKVTWILLTTLSLLVVFLFRPTFLLSYIGIIVSCVYLADVRPAVREISGPPRW